MQQLVFATNNKHKLEEAAAKIQGRIKVLSLDDIGFYDDIAETGLTFRENASLKSNYIYNNYHLNCFGDDSGLAIDALLDAPGVYSARYTGKHGDHEANMDKVLAKLALTANRSARFRTVISLLWDGGEYFFEGAVEGTIRYERAGLGFAYDPIFQPDGYKITFAEMSLAEKNRISHRAKAIDKMVDFLKTLDGSESR
jgi:XTP/dITP diphosphohydrolase